jgi:hypothetical protein
MAKEFKILKIFKIFNGYKITFYKIKILEINIGSTKPTSLLLPVFQVKDQFEL